MYHLIIYTPIKAANAIRSAASNAGAGSIGNYSGCSFSSRGIGRFCGNNNSNPAIGTPTVPEEAEEERIEMLTQESVLADVLRAVTKVHPYEEPAIHVLPAMDYKDFL